MSFTSYLRVGSLTTLNLGLHVVTKGRFLWLEGRASRGVFRNWARDFRYVPTEIARPKTLDEIVGLVQGSSRLRVFGSGHSFNDGVVSDEVLVSLDDYSGLVHADADTAQVTVKAGTRVRDVVRLLADRGLAFRALPSHDAQSIGGILSTDVHGTGRDVGFVSDSVVGITVVDGNGEVHDCNPSDDLFRAAVGGVGAVGIISAVVVQGVPRFNVEQRVQMKSLGYVREHLDELVAANDHLSLYVYPYSDECQVNTWNRTEKDQSPVGDLRELVNISADALLAAWLGGFLAGTKLLTLSRLWSPLTTVIRRGSNLVLESNKAFNRSIYHLHQELEFSVPYEDALEVCDRFVKLYEDMFHGGLPYTLVEVRFTPDQHDRSLIGAGRAQHSAWIDLLCNDSEGFEPYYEAAEAVMKEIGARPHLGKYCKSYGADDLAKVHGESFARFLGLVEEHDPGGRFENAYTRRLFGTRAATVWSDRG